MWSHLPPDLPRQGRNKLENRTTGARDEDMIRFYYQQAERILNFVAEHPSLHLVEVAIDQPNAGQVMEDAFGISQQCWGNKNINRGDAKWTES